MESRLAYSNRAAQALNTLVMSIQSQRASLGDQIFLNCNTETGFFAISRFFDTAERTFGGTGVSLNVVSISLSNFANVCFTGIHANHSGLQIF